LRKGGGGKGEGKGESKKWFHGGARGDR